MATKKVLTKKFKCVSIQHNTHRSNVVLAADIAQGEKGAAARNVINISLADAKELAGFEINSEYIITIEK
jgi:hypothetical protein